MKNTNYPDAYKPLIKKLKFRKRLIKIVTVLAFFASAFFLAPDSEIIINDTVIHTSFTQSYTGAVIAAIAIAVGSVFAYSVALLPLQTAMLTECDPEKHMVLNEAVGNKKQLDSVYAIDYLFLGKFEAACEYAARVSANKNVVQSACGWFHKARCEFLMKNYGAFENSFEQYKAVTAKIKNAKQKAEFDKMQKVLELMLALCGDDTEKIKACNAQAAVWNESKGAHGFTNYIKGLAACRTGDIADCIYYMTFVKKNCEKTVFAALADEVLAGLPQNEK